MKFVWSEIENKLNLQNIWIGDYVEACLKLWNTNEILKEYQSLHLIVSWGIWLAWNVNCFDDKYILPIQVAYQSLGILKYFPQDQVILKNREIVEESIDFNKSWAYFDGAARGIQEDVGLVGFYTYLRTTFFSSKLD